MAVNYSKQQAQDRNDVPVVATSVPFPAIASTYRDNSGASSVTSLNANTTLIEVTAAGSPAVLKWTGAAVTPSVVSGPSGANFDNAISVGETRRFVVPRSVMGIPNWNANNSPSIVGLNTSEGLYPGVATLSVGVGSVLLTQY